MYFKNIMCAVVCALFMCENISAQNDSFEYTHPVSEIKSSTMRLVRFRPADGRLENDFRRVVSQVASPISEMEFSKYVLYFNYIGTPFFSPWIIYARPNPHEPVGFAFIRSLNKEVVSVYVSDLKAAETKEFERLMTAYISGYVDQMLVDSAIFEGMWQQSKEVFLWSADIDQAKREYMCKHGEEPSFTPKVLIFNGVNGFDVSRARVCKLDEPSTTLVVELVGGDKKPLVYTNDFVGSQKCIFDRTDIGFVHSSAGTLQAGVTVVLSGGAAVLVGYYAYKYRAVLGPLWRNFYRNFFRNTEE